jgi:methylated-DNA-protein-cysteine methyltransferase-like protein
MSNNELHEKIRQTISRVPQGSVATYGQIAAEAGVPRRARLVGQVLKRLPAGSGVPWHRIINAQGAISFTEGSEAWLRQKGRLEEEGVVFRNGHVNLEEFRWRPSLDELLWGPAPE